MSKNSNFDQYDLFDEYDEIDGQLPKMRNRIKNKKRPRLKDRYNIIEEPQTANLIYDQADDRRTLNITYKASKTEAIWLSESLGGMFEHQWLEDVLQIVKGGKEASVYMCKGNATTGQELLAAKVYRPRMFRALRNDAMYREGRQMLDEDGLIIRREGPLKAIRNRTRLGDQLIHQSWIMHEVEAIKSLYEAGFDVPAVYANGDNAILMEYIGNEEMEAPVLHDVKLNRKEAQILFDRLIFNIEGMLSLDYIHGDLSAFNILYWQGDICIIDFPQVVSPDGNRSAYQIFSRDILRVCEYFQRQGLDTDAKKLASGLWRQRGKRTSPRANPAFLDPNNDEDVAYWQKYK